MQLPHSPSSVVRYFEERTSQSLPFADRSEPLLI
jgi:hypothetical protein